jgi:hypothetical protein
MTKKRVEIAPLPEAPKPEVESTLEDDVIEIDTDEHFGRKNTGKVQAAEAKKVDTTDLDDDLLYDLC